MKYEWPREIKINVWPGSELSTSVTAIAKSHTVSGCRIRNLTNLPRTMQNDQNMNDFSYSVYLRAVRSPQPVFIYCYSSCTFSSLHPCVFHNAVLHTSSSNTSECRSPSERDTRLSRRRGRADNVRQLHSLAFCWLLLTRSFDLERSNASSICNSSRQNSSGVLRCSGWLRNVCRELCIDVSGQYISPSFKGLL